MKVLLRRSGAFSIAQQHDRCVVQQACWAFLPRTCNSDFSANSSQSSTLGNATTQRCALLSVIGPGYKQSSSTTCAQRIWPSKRSEHVLCVGAERSSGAFYHQLQWLHLQGIPRPLAGEVPHPYNAACWGSSLCLHTQRTTYICPASRRSHVAGWRKGLAVRTIP